jgi:hypothetical protein
MSPPRPAKAAQRAHLAGAATGPRRRNPGLLRPPGPDERGGFSAAILFVISNMSYFAVATIVAVHLLFAREEHSFAVRLLTATPGVLLVLEGRRFLKDEAGELPFVVLALLQYYAVFCFGVFFDLKFYDFHGLVSFSPDARLNGATAVAIGAACVWLAGRLGRHVGRDLQGWATKVMPPAEVPEQWDTALFLYSGACAVMMMATTLLPGIVPPSVEQPVLYALPIELALGFMLVVPPRRLGARMPQLLVAYLIAIGLLRGSLDAAFRGGIAYIAGRWAVARAISIRLAVAVVTLYVLLQPVKASYRQQVWVPGRSGQSMGVSDRVGAWSNAFSVYFSDRESSVSDDAGAMQRLSELGAVMHAFQVLPGRVQFLDGKGLLPILYAPIPRFLWRDKPTTRDTVQRYGVVFGRQSEEGALSTAINLPLVVEGYWNLGWPGILLVTGALGFWVGLSQKVFAGKHWALRATGIANLTNLTVAGPIVFVYGTIFQVLVSRTAVCWGLFWLATMLSRRRYDVRSMARHPRAHGLARHKSR